MSAVLDLTSYKERFKVVVAWEGSYEVSEPIIFENIDSTKADPTVDSTNEIVFRLLRRETTKNALGEEEYSIIEDNSIGNFYVYDENNQCIKNQNNEFYSDIYYYI